MSESFPPRSGVIAHLVVAGADRAVAAVAKTLMAPADMVWGDRYAQVRDPFGHHWSRAHALPKP